MMQHSGAGERERGRVDTREREACHKYFIKPPREQRDGERERERERAQIDFHDNISLIEIIVKDSCCSLPDIGLTLTRSGRHLWTSTRSRLLFNAMIHSWWPCVFISNTTPAVLLVKIT